MLWTITPDIMDNLEILPLIMREQTKNKSSEKKGNLKI